MTNWINVAENWDITLTYNWDSITIQGDDLPGFYQFGQWEAPEWYHIPSKDEWNKLLQMRALSNGYKDGEINLNEIFALEDSEQTDKFMTQFNLHFNWWGEETVWAIDDWDDHWRYWSSTEATYDGGAYAFRLCGTYAFVNDFNKSHRYSIRCFKD